MNSTLKTLLIGGLSVFVLEGCRSSPKQENYKDEEKTGTVVSYGGGAGGRNSLINIPMSIEYGLFGLLGTPATAYSVDLSGCLSAYSATVTQANLDGVEVYKDDRNCLAKLTSFTVGGTTYTSTDTGAVNFTTWLANDTAIFASSGGAIIRVKVVSQLASPIAGTEAIVYNFSELLDGVGDHTFSEADVSDAHSITVESQEAPHFNVVGATYVGMDDITGAGEFTFKLECVDDPAGAANPINMTDTGGANTQCSQNNLADITYKLVKDTYGSVLTITDAETIFGTAGASVSIPGDQYVDVVDTNEGFNTSVLDGPGALGTAGNENMILILKGGLSFTYFNVDVTTIVQ